MASSVKNGTWLFGIKVGSSTAGCLDMGELMSHICSILALDIADPFHNNLTIVICMQF